MEALLAVAVGALYAGGVYLILRRSLFKLVIGLGLLANGTNLLIFTAAGLSRDGPPLIAHDAKTLGASADPLAQALILTAIVITLGVSAFAFVLVLRTREALGSDDPDAMVVSDGEDA